MTESFNFEPLVIYQFLLPDQTNEAHQHNKVEKHGPCVVHYSLAHRQWRIRTAQTYLCTAADLATKHNMGKYLKNVPLGQEYEIGYLTNIIKEGCGVYPDIRFLTDNSRKHYLSEIFLHFNPDMNMINAPQTHDEKLKVTYLECEDNNYALEVPTHNSNEGPSSTHSESTKEVNEAPSCSHPHPHSQ